MSRDFFARLEAELGGLTQAGRHLEPTARCRRRWLMLIRRAVASGALALALAASLDSEFPATASGRAPVAQMWTVPGA